MVKMFEKDRMCADSLCTVSFILFFMIQIQIFVVLQKLFEFIRKHR